MLGVIIEFIVGMYLLGFAAMSGYARGQGDSWLPVAARAVRWPYTAFQQLVTRTSRT